MVLIEFPGLHIAKLALWLSSKLWKSSFLSAKFSLLDHFCFCGRISEASRHVDPKRIKYLTQCMLCFWNSADELADNHCHTAGRLHFVSDYILRKHLTQNTMILHTRLIKVVLVDFKQLPYTRHVGSLYILPQPDLVLVIVTHIVSIS